MLEGHDYSKKEIGLGLAALLVLAGIAVAIARYEQIGRMWRARQEILVVFSDVGGLTPDAPVRYNGVEIGRVKSIRTVHLDEALVEKRFGTLTESDLKNLPITSEEDNARLEKIWGRSHQDFNQEFRKR